MANRTPKKRGGKINIESFQDAILEQLNDYEEYVSGVVIKEAVSKTAEQTAELISKEAPVKTGKYAKSITSGDKLLRGRSQKAYYKVVYAEAPEYRLTHLLEKPHALRSGGRSEKRMSEPKEHWKPGADNVPDLLVKNVKELLK